MNRLQPQKVVNLGIFKPNLNEVLLIYRNNETYKNYWGMPGGKVEKDEFPYYAAIRELKQETGICGTKPEFSGRIFEKVFPQGELIYDFDIFLFNFYYCLDNFKESSEGKLSWEKVSELEKLNIIPSDLLMINNVCLNGNSKAKSVIFKEGDKYFLKSFEVIK